MKTNKKAASGISARAASKLRFKLNSFGNSLWVLGYSLEEERQTHAKHGRFLKRMACCIGLVVLRWISGAQHHA